ncbi:MAG: lipocalin family protein [Flavobacterium sp.]
MKNRSLLFALTLLMGVFAISCNNDDNGGETLVPLIGKWNLNQVGILVNNEEVLIDAPQNQAGCNKDYLELKVGNDANEGDYDSTESPCQLTVKTGSYSRTNNNLTTTIDGNTKTQDIMNLSTTELKVKDDAGFISVYTRN